MASHNLSWFQNAFVDLQNDMLISQKLKEIKVALTGLHSSQLGSLANALSLKILFDCLNSFEKNQVDMTCDVLKMLLSSLPPIVMFQHYEVELARALKHPEKRVKETILYQLSRLESERDIELLLTKRPSFITDILFLLRDEDLAIAQTAIDLLTRIGKTEYGFKSLLTGDTDSLLRELEGSGAINSLRAYQVIFDIGCESEDKLSKLEAAGLLRGFGKLLSSDDILGKMAAIEELSKLVSTPHGYRFLSRQNCIHVLAQELIDAPKSSMGSIITPGLLKFFGCACQKHAAEIHRDYSQVVDTVISLAYSDDLTIATTAIEAIGFICSSSQGKLLLNQTGDASMMKMARRIEEMISKGQVEWKHRILYALANLLSVQENDLENNEVVFLTQKWLSYMGDNLSAICLLFNLSKNPFPEVKLSAFYVLSKIARLQWGQYEISKNPDGLKYLLDRTTETDMTALLAKYEVILALANSPTAASVFNEVDFNSIAEYKNQGATYVPSKLFVAVEGAE